MVMGIVYTRPAWNSIIDQINAKIASCASSVTPIPEVNPGHVWTPDDVTLVRKTLTQLCTNGPVFSAPLTIWAQSVIDEISTALANCVCQPLSYVISLALPLPFTSSTTTTSNTTSQADGQLVTTTQTTKTVYTPTTPFAQLMDGIQIGTPSKALRSFSADVDLTMVNTFTWSSNPSADIDYSGPYHLSINGSVDSNGYCHGTSASYPGWAASYFTVENDTSLVYYPGSPYSWTVSSWTKQDYHVTGITAQVTVSRL